MLAQDDSAPRRRRRERLMAFGCNAPHPTTHLIRFFAWIAIGIVRWEPYVAGLLRNGAELCATGALAASGAAKPALTA